MNTPSIFNPDKTVELSSGEKVAVQMLKWKSALKFFEMLEANFKQLLDGQGNLSLDSKKIIQAISKNSQLAEWLVLEATKKEAAWLETLDISDMTKLVIRAVEINLSSIGSEIKNFASRWRAMAGSEPDKKLNPTSPPSATP